MCCIRTFATPQLLPVPVDLPVVRPARYRYRLWSRLSIAPMLPACVYNAILRTNCFPAAHNTSFGFLFALISNLVSRWYNPIRSSLCFGGCTEFSRGRALARIVVFPYSLIAASIATLSISYAIALLNSNLGVLNR